MKSRFFRNVIAFLVVVLILSIFISLANATSAEELLKNPNLTDMERNALASAISKQAQNESLIPKSLEGLLEWQKMGDAFASTIERICKTLRIEVNEFLKSDVGMLTAGIIIYRMVGQDFLRIVLYTLIWIGVTFFMIMSIRFLHMKKLVPGTIPNPEKNGPPIQTTVAIDRFGWADDIVKNVSLAIHIIAWFIFSCIMAYYVI
jgi:hypothetical protein